MLFNDIYFMDFILVSWYLTFSEVVSKFEIIRESVFHPLSFILINLVQVFIRWHESKIVIFFLCVLYLFAPFMLQWLIMPSCRSLIGTWLTNYADHTQSWFCNVGFHLFYNPWHTYQILCITFETHFCSYKISEWSQSIGLTGPKITILRHNLLESVQCNL